MKTDTKVKEKDNLEQDIEKEITKEDTVDNNLEDEFGESEEVLLLKNKIETLEEKVRYAQAELINYRKRKDEEVANMLKFANQDLILEILPIVDIFERAIKLSNNTNESIIKFVEGFKMMYTNLVDTLKKFGVEEINPIDAVFDPMYHNALLVEENKEKEDGIVLDVLQKGYMLKGRVIRPAAVKVNKLNKGEMKNE